MLAYSRPTALLALRALTTVRTSTTHLALRARLHRVSGGQAAVRGGLLGQREGRLRRRGRRGQSRRHHHEAGCQQVLPLRGENSTSTPASHVSRVPQSDPAPKATTRNDPIHAPIRPDTPRYDPDEQTTTSHRPSISETAKSSRKSFFSFSPPAPPRRRSHWTLP